MSSATQVRSALVSAFVDYGDLEIMVHDQLGVRLGDIASPALPLPQVVFKLVRWAETRGMIEELVCGAHADRPGNELLGEVAAEFSCADHPSPPRTGRDSALVWEGIRRRWRDLRDLHEPPDANADDVSRAINALNESADDVRRHPELADRFRENYGEDFRTLYQKLVKHRYPTTRPGMTSAELLTPGASELFETLKQP